LLGGLHLRTRFSTLSTGADCQRDCCLASSSAAVRYDSGPTCKGEAS